MSKKKAIKLATASVLAASSFAAVAPFTTQAATSVADQVTKATNQMKKAQDTYLAVGKTGKVVSAKTVQTQVDLAKKYYDAAKKAVIKAGGKNKDKYLAKLADATTYYNHAKAYIKALGNAQKVGVAGLEAATIKGDIATVKATAKKLSAATTQLKKDVYGADVEKVLIKQYLTLSPAVNAYFYADSANYWVTKGNLATAELRMETVTKSLAKVDASSQVGKVVSAYVKTVQDKIEALKAPKVESVSAINNIEVDQNTALADVKLPATVTATLSDKTTKDVAVKWDTTKLDLTKEGTYALTGAIEGTTVTASVNVVVKAVAPTVTSVSAINLKEVKVDFNTKVDKDSAENTANYTFSGAATVNDARLSEDGKSVTLALYLTNDDTAALTADTDYTLDITNVKNTAGTAIADTSKEFKVAADSTIPTVESVEVLGLKTLRVKFSEPVKATAAENVANWSINDGNVTIGSVTLDKNTVNDETYRVATVNLTDALTPGQHKLVVNGTGAIQDFAGFAVVPFSKQLDVQADTAAPTLASVTVNSRTEAVLEFSEGVKSLGNTDVFWSTSSTATSGTTSASVLKLADNKYKVTFSGSNILPASGKVYVYVPTTNLTDYSNNKLPALQKAEVTVPVEAAPTVSSVTTTNDKTFYVKFNKSMNDGTSSGQTRYANHYTFLDENGKVVTGTTSAGLDSNGHPSGATLTYDTTEKQVKIEFNSADALPGGKYQIKVDGVKDTIGTAVAATTNTVTVKDSTAPIFKASNSYDLSTSTLVINFNEAMSVSGDNSILNSKNYKVQLASVGAGFKEFPSGTKFEAINDNKSVKITLPTGKSFTNGDDVTVGYLEGTKLSTVADATGNLMNPTNLNNIVTDSTAVDISDAGVNLEVTSPTTLALTLPSTMNSFDTIEADDFRVTKTAQAWAAATDVNVTDVKVDADNKRKLIITIADEDKFTANDTGASIRVLTDTTAGSINSKDSLGNKITSSVSAQLDSNKIKPELKSVAVVDPTTLRLTFDSNFDTTVGNLSALANDLIVVQGDKSITGANLSISGVNAVSNASKVVDVTLQNNNTIDSSKSVTVKTVAQDLIDAEGANTALLKANETGVTSSDFVAQSLAFGAVATPAQAATGAIKVANNAIDTATQGTITGSAAPTGTIDMDDDGAGNGTVNQNNTIQVSVDGGAPQTVTIQTADVVNPDAVTAAEIVAQLDSDLVGASATIDGAGKVVITSDTYGAGSSVDITDGAVSTYLELDTGSAPTTADGADGDVVTVNNTTLVFAAGTLANGASRVSVAVGGTADITENNIRAALAGEAATVTAAQNGSDNTQADLTAVTPGVAGNSITLTKTDGDNDITLTPFSGGAAIAASNNTLENGESITIQFSRNVDPATVKEDWDGSSVAVTDLVTVDEDSDTIKFASGINIGTITTAGIQIGGADNNGDVASLNGTLQFTDNRTLVITFTEAPGSTTAISAGQSSFEADSAIKTSTGTVITNTFKPVTAGQF